MRTWARMWTGGWSGGSEASRERGVGWGYVMGEKKKMEEGSEVLGGTGRWDGLMAGKGWHDVGRTVGG